MFKNCNHLTYNVIHVMQVKRSISIIRVHTDSIAEFPSLKMVCSPHFSLKTVCSGLQSHYSLFVMSTLRTFFHHLAPTKNCSSHKQCHAQYGMCFEGKCHCVGMHVGDGVSCRGKEHWKITELVYCFLNRT